MTVAQYNTARMARLAMLASRANQETSFARSANLARRRLVPPLIVIVGRPGHFESVADVAHELGVSKDSVRASLRRGGLCAGQRLHGIISGREYRSVVFDRPSDGRKGPVRK